MSQEQPKLSHPVLCPTCGKPMRFARSIPALGALPELLTFECRDCIEAVTFEKDALRAPAEGKLLEPAA